MSDPVDFQTGGALPFGYTADTAPAGVRWLTMSSGAVSELL